MQNRLPQNTNLQYKVFIRQRPIEFHQRMIEINGETITIKDPTNKQSEKQQFQFSQIFDPNSQQDIVFKQTCEPSLMKLIEGHNSCIMGFGSTGSGKTFSIFGEDVRFSISPGDIAKDRRGIVARSLEFLLLKSLEYAEMREFVMTVSMAEIYLDQIRDLGRGWGGEGKIGNPAIIGKAYESENLSIYENTNGQIMVKDLSTVQLSTVNQLYEYLQTAFQLRQRYESKSSQVWARAHTIFTLNLVQQDKDNENLPFMNATIQFVDLAGSERIAKSLTEGHKFQEAILINSSLTALGKCLSCLSQGNQKNLPYRESKLTRVLQNCLGTNSNVVLIASVNPSESNYEECLSTLQFADRSKNIQLKGAQVSSGNSEQEMVMSSVNQFSGQDKQIKKLNDEISEFKSRLEFKEREYKNRVNEIQTLMGIEIDFDKIFSKSGTKELNQFKQQKEAVSKLETVQKLNLELEHKNQKLLRIIEELKKEDTMKQEKYSCTLLELKEQCRRLKDALTVAKMNSEDGVRQLNNEREQEVKRMIEKSNALLEEKVSIIVNLPQNIQSKTNENSKIQEVKRASRLEVEKELKGQIDNIRTEHSKLLQAAREEYEFYLRSKNDEIENFLGQFKKYREKKKQTMGEVKSEMLEMFDIMQKQQRIIERVEQGAYSAGIKSFNIPARDKPIIPSRQRLKNVYKFLDQRSLLATKSQFQDNTIIPPIHQDGIMDNVDLSINITKMTDQMVKPFCEQLRDQLRKALNREREQKKQLEAYSGITDNVDLVALTKERDEYKQLYLHETKKYNQSRVVLESQKRFINKASSNEAALIRPLTTPQNSRYRLRQQ